MPEWRASSMPAWTAIRITPAAPIPVAYCTGSDVTISVTNAQTATCAIELQWSPATAVCGSSVVYNVYRSETAGFVPGPDSLIASCLAQTGFTDEEIPTQVQHHYVVRAEDSSVGHGGRTYITFTLIIMCDRFSPGTIG